MARSFHRTRRPTVRLWRWRANPLRRRSDVVEAWTVLVFGIAAVVGGPAAGAVTAVSVVQVVDEQRAHRHAVTARLIEDAPRSTAVSRNGTGLDRVRARVRWAGPDGATHRGTTLVAPGTRAGARTTVWTDGQGTLVLAPLERAEAVQRAVVAGVLATAAVTGVAARGGLVVRRRLMGRRTAAWGREWARVGPQWSRRAG
ncbi:Rv1733c family protein [Actinomycetota bacterium Odt1-20B]